jgi:Skp family chaperone for outer membrane proteins
MKKLLFACLLVLAPVSLASADLKVAVIDLGKAFDGYYKTKDAQTKLKAKQDTYQKQVQDLITDYQHMSEEADALQKGAQDPTLSKQAQQDKSNALEQKKQDLINLGNKIQEMKVEKGREIQEELLRRHKEIVDEITKAVSDYSGGQGFDIVIDKSSQSAASGVPIVLYNSAKLTDITQTILDSMNKSAPAGGAAPAGEASGSSTNSSSSAQ